MPFLQVNTIVVPVALDGATVEMELIGDRARAFDGTMRSTRRATKRRWQIKTAPMTAADAQALLAVLLGTPPVTCTGDCFVPPAGASVLCDPEVRTLQHVATGSADRRTLEFILHEV